METGIRRLWTRKKSSSRLRQATKSSEARGNDIPPLPQTSFPPSQAVAPLANQMHPKSVYNRQSLDEYGRQDMSFKTVSNGQSVTRSGNKIQPILVGISRPSTAQSRPATAGSLQQAVNQAADSVTYGRPGMSQVENEYTKGHTRTRSPKYVDVFAVSAAYHSARPRFNEDVAARNLDLDRVVKLSLNEITPERGAHMNHNGLEESQHQYVPSSRYQEEVAQRNAYPSDLSGTDLDRPSIDSALDQSAISPSVPMSRPTMNDSAAVRPLSQNYSPLRTSSAAHGGRQHDEVYHGSSNQRVVPPPQPTHRTIHASTNADAQQKPIIESTKNYESELALSKPTYPAAHTANHIQSTSLVQPGAQAAPPRSVDAAVPRNTPRRPPMRSAQSSFQYTVSLNELANSRSYSTEVITQRALSPPARPMPPRTYSGLTDGSTRPGSAMSNISALKKTLHLNTRTIMDLTGNDSEIFSDIYPDSEYSASPVVAMAVQDPLHRGHAALVTAPGRPNRLEALASIASSDEGAVPAPLKIQREVEGQVQDLSARSKQATALRPPPPQHMDSTSSFSRITTVASVAPAVDDSVLARTPAKSFITADNEAESPLVAVHRSQNTAPTRSFDNERGYPLGNLLEKSDIVGRSDVNETSLKTLDSSASRPPAPGAAKAALKGTRPPSQRRQSSEDKTFAQRGSPSAAINHIHNSPESLKSNDFVNPSSSFGVLTRDFAVSPKSSTVPKQHPPRNSALTDNYANARSRGPGSYRSGVRTNMKKDYVYKSSFNEEDFARKQAEARAALTRLQESLAQSFDQPTETVSGSGDGLDDSDTSQVSSRQHGPPRSKYTQSRTLASIDDTEDSPQVTTVSPSRTFSAHQLTTQPTTSNISKPVSRMKASSRTNSTSKVNELEAMLSDMNKSSRPGPRTTNSSVTLPARTSQSATTKTSRPEMGALPMPRMSSELASKTPVPPSPGEISLSSFPIPVPGKGKEATLAPEQPRAGLVRRGSARSNNSFRSQTSNVSQFSIPIRMVPGRSSSMRDRLAVEEEEEAEAYSFDL